MHVPPPGKLLAELGELPAVRVVIATLGESVPVPRVAVVGGAVRDLLRGTEPFDVDFAVQGSLAPLAPLLDDGGQSHDRFATLTLQTEAGPIDVAQARRERYPHPGALPEVEPATLEEDLGRRDFTVNALAVPLTGEGAGTLLSHPAALDDLEQRRLAVLHDRSFTDDPTRLLRLARYRSRLGFEIAPHTLELARTATSAGALQTISGQRLGGELRLLAAEPDPEAALRALSELGVDTAIASGFGLGDPMGTQTRALAGALDALPAEGRPDLLALSVACARMPSETRRDLLDRLGFPAADRDVILEGAARAVSLADELARTTRPSELSDAIGELAIETVALAGGSGDARAHENAVRWLSELRLLAPAITGDDLLAAGIPAGPALGAGLAAARAALLDEAAPDRESQLAVAIEAARRRLSE